MKTMLRRAPLWAVLWSASVRAQPAPPPPLPPPAPLPPLPPPAPPPPPSGGVTGVREPDTASAPPAPVDQGPDTLPSLDEEVPPAPAPVVAPPVAAAAPLRPPPPIRAQRRIALLGELGWNGLAGFGAIVTYHAHPHVSFDLGAGLAAVGGKLGLRARYNISKKPVTPFLGMGIMGATGFDAPTRDIGSDDSEINIELKPAAFLQAVAGIDWTSPSGFTLIGAAGYAWLVTGDNVVILTGEPTPEEEEALDAVFRSGVVISVAIGYTFR
jgi:hypothetical protein